MQNLLQKAVPYIMKFSSLRVVKALKNGFIRTVPITLIGSLFLLIAAFPFDGFTNLMVSLFGDGWNTPLYQVSNGTFTILAIFTGYAIGTEYCSDDGIDGIPAGMFAVSGLIIMMQVQTLDGISALATSWLGGMGLISAVICGLLSGAIYTWFIKRDIRIKLPENVPPAVANSFSALIPGVVIMTVFMLLHIAVYSISGLYVTEAIYSFIQAPLQSLTDSLPGIIIVAVLISLFWWCGIHGDGIILGILAPITQANMMANKALVDAGVELVAGENAFIITDQFTLFLKMGGAGSTLGLAVAMCFFAKSTQMRQLGRLAIGPSLFNINEPLIFGTPIIYNPVMLVPFMLAPTVSVTLAYLAISSGLVPAFGGIVVPWTMPTVLSGLITGGWETAVLQAILVAISALIYLPFFKLQDKLNLNQEQGIEDVA